MGLKANIKQAIAATANAQQKRITNAFAEMYHYDPKLPDGTDNPQGKLGFAATRIADFVGEVVYAYEKSEAMKVVAEPPRMDTGEEDVKA